MGLKEDQKNAEKGPKYNGLIVDVRKCVLCGGPPNQVARIEYCGGPVSSVYYGLCDKCMDDSDEWKDRVDDWVDKQVRKGAHLHKKG